jgi:hypothetical protein
LLHPSHTSSLLSHIFFHTAPRSNLISDSWFDEEAKKCSQPLSRNSLPCKNIFLMQTSIFEY